MQQNQNLTICYYSHNITQTTNPNPNPNPNPDWMQDLLPISRLQAATALCVPIQAGRKGRGGAGEGPVGVILVLKEASSPGQNERVLF